MAYGYEEEKLIERIYSTILSNANLPPCVPDHKLARSECKNLANNAGSALMAFNQTLQ